MYYGVSVLPVLEAVRLSCGVAQNVGSRFVLCRERAQMPHAHCTKAVSHFTATVRYVLPIIVESSAVAVCGCGYADGGG